MDEKTIEYSDPMNSVAEKNIHEVFVWSVVLKGVGAAFETALGFLLLFGNDAVQFVLDLVRNGLLDDPNGFLSRHLSTFLSPSVESQTFGGLYLLSHGIVKLALVAGLLRNKLWAYPASLAVMGLFIAYQVVRWLQTHSIFLVLLTIFDVAVVWLIWHEYQLIQKHRVVE